MVRLNNCYYLDADRIGRAIERLGRFFSEPIRVAGTPGGSEPLSEPMSLRKAWLQEEIDKSNLRSKLIDAYNWAVKGTPLPGVNTYRDPIAYKFLFMAYDLVNDVFVELGKMGVGSPPW
jgi:hypothetical protein